MSKSLDSPRIPDEEATYWGGENANYEAHLAFDHVVSPEKSTPRERFEAMARTVRDHLTDSWVQTYERYDRENPKTVYYLSMEFLIGRSLVNNVINMGMWPHVERFLNTHNLSWTEIVENENDAGLGNGGLGRLAACFIESMATLGIPAIGYGLRYEYGIFRQEIRGGYQVEQPDHWLRFPDPWEVSRHGRSVDVTLGCSFEMHEGKLHQVPGRPMMLVGIPYDRPVVGHGGRTVNGLRLWGAMAHDQFNFGEFNKGDFVASVVDKIVAETLTRVLYPDDSTARGQSLRFLQEYFLVACSLADIIRRFRRRGNDWSKLPEKVAIQLNDTHPAMSVAELMRILLDQAGLDFDTAWDLTQRTLAYTNHTILPEALEKWPIEYFEIVLPRHLEIIYEINDRFLAEVAKRHPGDIDRERRMSLIEEQPQKKVRMAHLAIVGSHSTNGVAEIHTRLLKTHVLADFAEMFPERFNNKTNGVTPRRWLLQCNPALARLITDAIGDRWITHLDELARLRPLADDASFRARFRDVKHEAKLRFTDWLRNSTSQIVDPECIIDCQVKRIHEYKRQLLNVLNIVSLYLKLHDDPHLEMPPRAFLLAGKAAPSYKIAKVIIKLINCVAETVNADPVARGKMTVHFLPDYSVTLAERLIPASDVSEQISTAGYEASGTGCMKFMMNGALTVATRDGANIEMAAEVGEENMFLFGLSAEQVSQSRSWYNPMWHYEHDRDTRRVLDLIFSDHFNPGEPGLFTPLKDLLLTRGDFYMNLADLSSYSRTQARISEQYGDVEAWSRKAVLNIAASGKFSSDRTILEYARDIWDARPCLPEGKNGKG